MKLENQVCSRPLAVRLKELGVKQESLFWWINYTEAKENEFWHIKTQEALVEECWKFLPEFDWHKRETSDLYIEFERLFTHHYGIKDSVVAAFTVAELGEMLPKSNHAWESGWNSSSKDYVVTLFYNEQPTKYEGIHYEHGNTEADARAKMLIYLLENGLLKM